LPVTTPASSVTGVILAGGFGTRLRPVLSDRPKVLAEVAGRPFLFLLLDQMADAGVSRVILCTGHLGEQVRSAIAGSYRGMEIAYSHEETPLGTAGALRQAAMNSPGDLFLAMNGDSYTAADLSAFLCSHSQTDALGSILLAWAPDCARYGTVAFDGAGRVVRFIEKRGVAAPGWINAGIYLLSREVLEAMPARTPLSLETEVFPAIDGLRGYCVRTPFIDIGTPESLARATTFVTAAKGRATARRFVAVDRDGTIIAEKNYICRPEDVELLPNAAAALRHLREMGLGIVVVSNQSGVGRGYFGIAEVERVNARVSELLAEVGVSVDAVYVCPHAPDERCACRKPEPGLLTQANGEFGLDPEAAFVIGDKQCDIDLGRRMGATTFLVQTGYGREHLAKGWAKPDFVVDDLGAAACSIEAILKGPMEDKAGALVNGAEERMRKHLLGSIGAKQRLLDECDGPILAAAGAIASAMAAGGKMLLCGNGGSAADCQHIAGEMVSVLNQNFPRPGLAAIALTTDSSILTASANDFGYAGVFERQVQALGKPGDVVVGISTSGGSENVVRALCYAARNGMRTIGLTGAAGGRVAETSDIAIRVPSACVQHIQESHITIGHILCDLVERTLFPGK
jgi:phosphoheptose isomerase